MLQALSLFALAMVPFLFNGSYNIIIDLLNAAIVAIGPAAQRIVSQFPSNPCGSLIASCTDAVSALPAPDPTLMMLAVKTICWILPMSFLANLVGCMMLTVMIFFTMAPLARWLKLLN